MLRHPPPDSTTELTLNEPAIISTYKMLILSFYTSGTNGDFRKHRLCVQVASETGSSGNNLSFSQTRLLKMTYLSELFSINNKHVRQ